MPPANGDGDRLIRLRRPTEAEIARCLAREERPFSHAEVGATDDLGSRLPESLASTYDLDHHHFVLGSGRDRFERARAALESWRQYEVPWLELHGGSAPARSGQVVATLVSLAGFWFLNPCRVVYTRFPSEPTDVVAFAYGTLEGHVLSGEERFVVSFDPASAQVHYEVAAFSRPAKLLSKLGYPFARRLQRRFAAASAEAITRAIG